MRAAVIRKFGSLTVEEVPSPEPRGDEVLAEVRAAAINPSDVKNVAGAMHGTTLPRIPGRDFAGVVKRGPADLVGKEVWGTGGDIGFTPRWDARSIYSSPASWDCPASGGIERGRGGERGRDICDGLAGDGDVGKHFLRGNGIDHRSSRRRRIGGSANRQAARRG